MHVVRWPSSSLRPAVSSCSKYVQQVLAIWLLGPSRYNNNLEPGPFPAQCYRPLHQAIARCQPPGLVFIKLGLMLACPGFWSCLCGVLGVPRRGSFCPWIGCRVGEASNPGPDVPGQSLTVAVVNPTAVLHKARTFAQVNAQVILVSESSATAHVQAIMSPKLRQQGFKAFWGEPVPEQQKVASGHCLRGLAVGTAIFSSVPARPSISPFPMEQQQSCRISECFIRLRSIEVRIIVIYGFPTCHVHAAAKTNMLLSWAYQRATASQIPTLIGGDMNASPQTLPIWSAFQQLGWVEIGEFMRCAYNVILPPTCKGSTSPDTLLVPPCLQQFLQGADVLSGCGLFDAHEPLRVHFRFPNSHLQTMQWRMPKSWVEFEDDPSQLQAVYQQKRVAVRQATQLLGTDDVDSGQTVLGRALQTWSAVLEDTVSQVISQKARAEPHLEWPPALPRAYRGRCIARQRQVRHQPRLPRQALHGQPEPVGEATSVRARQKLRQCRRLHVFLQGCRKLAEGNLAVRQPQLRQNLHEQWAAICRAAGYGVPFLHWALSWPEIEAGTGTL